MMDVMGTADDRTHAERRAASWAIWPASRRVRPILGLLLAVCLPGLVSAQGSTLVDQETVAFQLPAGAYTTDFHFDVPEGATKFRIDLDSSTPGVDLDLFLREGRPFAGSNAYGLPLDFDGLIGQAQYFAIGSTAQEFITIGQSNYRPARPGRWHLAVLNFANQPVNATLRLRLSSDPPSPVLFQVRFDLPSSNCDVAPWTDPTPATPIGGNGGTTRGEQRRRALAEALVQLSAGLDSEVPITIRACWDNLTVSTSGGATLAAAGPNNFFLDDRSLVFADGSSELPRSSLPEKYSFYSAAPTARLAGTSACRVAGGDCNNVTDMRIVFNKRIGEAGVLNGAQFYLGFDRPPGPNLLDFVGVSVHELGHGLGFLSLVRNTDSASGPVGSKPLGRDDAYSRRMAALVDGELRPYVRLTDAQRAAALISGNGLLWVDPRALQSPFNPDPPPGIRLHAPNPIAPGSTASHLHTDLLGQLMTPSLSLAFGSRQLGLAVPMLYAVGWDPEATTFPTDPAPYAGLWFDRNRDGHGIDFQRIFTDANGYDVYALIFYTYDNAGQPEWYIAVGPMVDGVFQAATDASGNSLVRYRYGGPADPQQPVPTASGQIVIDFNQAETSPACNDGLPRDAAQLGVMRWTLAGTSGAWCIQELVPQSLRPAPDLTGTWFAGNADSGWGSSVTTAAVTATQRLLFSTLYYPDAGGNGRWGFVSTADYQPGQPVPVFERRGYCRNCPAVPLVDTQIGTMTASLVEPVQGVAGANRISFDVTFGGSGGGRFTRENVPYELLSAPQ